MGDVLLLFPCSLVFRWAGSIERRQLLVDAGAAETNGTVRCQRDGMNVLRQHRDRAAISRLVGRSRSRSGSLAGFSERFDAPSDGVAWSRTTLETVFC